MAAFAELFIDQGAAFNNLITLTDDVTNTSLNIVGYSARSQIRRSYYSTNATANIVCTITDGINGQITMSMTSANTANLNPNRYLFDVYTTTPGGVASRVIEGIITVTPSVSR